uniref:Skp1-related protein n=1 Tax=Meloidogyne incognita TaxID=6306 RepID=A0A914NX37_MELIC
IKCKTSDGGVINVRVSHLLQSSVFKNMWKDLDMSPKDLEEFEFKVNVETNIFSKVVEWMGEHIGKEDPKIEDDPATRQRKPLAFSEYETDFFKVGVEEIANLIKAANYLDIKSLYYSGCQALANVIGNKTPEELRELFGLEVGVEEIANLIKAANYLDIKSLYYSGCQALANVIGNKTPEELRELFGLEDDLTEDEKADIRRRNMWCNY